MALYAAKNDFDVLSVLIERVAVLATGLVETSSPASQAGFSLGKHINTSLPGW